MSDGVRERRGFQAPWVIFWVAFGLRVAVILIGHTYKLRSEFDHFNFGFEAGRIARSLVSGEGYANPFNGPSGPTAWLPPVYPLLMAAAFKLFGVYTRAAALAVLVVNSLFSAAIVPAVYEMAARCFDARGLARRMSVRAQPVALWSAWLWSVYPAALQYAVHWFWEMSVSACLFAWVTVWALRLRGVGEADPSGAKAPGDYESLMAVLKPRPFKAGVHCSDAGVHRSEAGARCSEAGVSPIDSDNNGGSLKAYDGLAKISWGGVGAWAEFGLLWGVVGLTNASLLILLAPMVLWVVWPQVVRPLVDQRVRGLEKFHGSYGVSGTLTMRWSFPFVSLRVKDDGEKPKAHAYFTRYRSTRMWLGVAVMGGVFCAVMMPWVVRNERVMHALIPTRSNLGIELYASTLESHDALPWGTALPVWKGDPEFKLFVRMGEVRFAAMRGAQARERIRANPRQFWRWTLDRFLYFWDGTPHPIDGKPLQEFGRELSYSFLSVCGVLGLALMLRRRVEGAGLFALVFLLLPIPYYLVTVQARFRHPMEPVIAVLAVYLFRSVEKKE